MPRKEMGALVQVMVIYDWALRALNPDDMDMCLCGYVYRGIEKVKVSLKVNMFLQMRRAKIAVCGDKMLVLEPRNIEEEYAAAFPNAYQDIKCIKKEVI